MFWGRTIGTPVLEAAVGAACLGAAAWLLASVAPQKHPCVFPWGDDPGALERGSASAPAPARPVAQPVRPRQGLAVPPILSYDIKARLDTQRHAVHAQATVRWTNASSQPVRELWVHLYLNAFAHTRTLFMRSPASSRRMATGLREPGGITVTRLLARELGNRDLWRGAAEHSPDDAADATDIRVPLPEPVAPGAALTLDLEWVARLPALVERTGYVGDFFAVAQWFPKIARLEPDGTWAHFELHPLSEFSADFGDYRVALDIPSGFALAATGHATSTRFRAGRRIVTMQARGVHDFAWVAWGNCVITKFDAGNVRVVVLSPHGRRRELDLTLATLKRGLPFFQQRYGTYPYPALHVVIPPDTAEAAGGMEYPTLITTGAPWYAPFVGLRAVQSVTAHELAHQWFYGLVASDEHAWPFLDEGLTSYAESQLMQRFHGAGSALHLPWLDVSVVAESRAVAVEYGRDEPIAQPADAFDDMDHLGALAYWRTSTLLRTLGNVYGPKNLEQALGSYARSERGKHPTPATLIRCVRQHLGDSAACNLQRALFERGWVDYSVERIETSPVAAPATVRDRIIKSRVLVRRRGTLAFPVKVALTTKSGSRSVRLWDGADAHHTFEHTGSEPVTSAIVDPEHDVLLDEDLLNNALLDGRRLPWRSLERGLSLAELVLLGLGP